MICHISVLLMFLSHLIILFTQTLQITLIIFLNLIIIQLSLILSSGVYYIIGIIQFWDTYAVYTIFTLVLFIIIYAIRKFELKHLGKNNLQLKENINIESKITIERNKSNLINNLSHEFRTPLTLILGPAENIITSDKKENITRNALLIKENASRLLQLLDQLEDFSKPDGDKLILRAVSSDLVSFIKAKLKKYEALCESKSIHLNVISCREEIEVYFDKIKMENIITNILSETFLSTPEGGKIAIEFSLINNSVIIKIKSTGTGIFSDDKTDIKDSLNGLNDNQNGRKGISIALTEELIKLHKGKIIFNNTQRAWPETIIILPLGKDHLAINELAEEEDFYELHNGTASEEIKDESYVILIVEDNADLRTYIKQSLGERFQVIEAPDGEQGLRKAERIIPDLIICDIMMPKMDGLELTRILKNNEKTDHIPVILLTAKSEQECKLNGLEVGADDYLVKPFDIQELKLRICNLVKLREKLHERFSHEHGKSADEKGPKLNSVNENFMNRVRKVIENHLAEENFNIEEFGKEVGMCRTQLHRKLKALTGKSASRYIRTYRLSTAKHMIETEKGNISEIAYSVGFSSPIYFSKCFKEEFGITPSELKLKNTHYYPHTDFKEL
jgi:DNA-binding response OmpR family regulator/signal transduction histidine kinase